MSSSLRNILLAECLEERFLLSAAYPTPLEQYMLELINQARANPVSYAASLGIDLNEGLAPNTISAAPKQPLVINPYLTDGAAQHSQWMLDSDTFSHTGSGGSSPTQRMTAAGYSLVIPWATGENIGWMGTTGSLNATAFTKSLEEALFVDAGIAGRGHRLNLMSQNFVEVGVGIRTGQFLSYNSVMATQDFGKSGSAMYFTGVAFSDAVTVDNFYTPGEGLGNISLVIIRDGNGARYETTTWSSGGFRLELPKGRYSIMATGPGLGPSQFIPSMNIGTQNMKRDFKVGWNRIAPEIAIGGNGRYIPHKDTTPRAADFTDFGSTVVSGGSITRTFSVVNFGNGTLNLSGSPHVVISGAHASDFEVLSQPSSTIAGGSTSDFTIRFDPLGAGLRTAIVTISSDDANESPFWFTIVGNGTDSAAMMAYLPQADSSDSGNQAPIAGQTPIWFEGPTASLVDNSSAKQLSIDSIDFDRHGYFVPSMPSICSGPTNGLGYSPNWAAV